MGTPTLDSLTDNSARDGTGDVIEGGEIDANPNALARILDGTTETMMNTDTAASDGLRIRVPEITDISAAAGGIRTGLRLRHDPSSGTVGDNDGIEILIQGDDDAGNKTAFAEIETYFTDVSNGSEDADVVFKTMIAGTAREMLSIGSTGFIFNEDSQDLDFRLETNNIANGFTSDGGLDTFAFGKAAVDDKFVSISTPAASHTATTDTYAFHVAPGGAQTIPSGTTALVASAAFEEPNITATGTVTSAATVYIKSAPTEGSSNYALWVDDGAVQIDSHLTVGGNITVTGGMTVAGANAFDIGDSDKLLLGDSDDLTVYHDGSNSYITNATGALKLATESSGIAVTIGHSTSETTVADNLTVTGTTTATGGIELSHATANTLTGSGGILSIEGVAIPTISSTDTLTNKTITSPTINTPTITGNTTFSDGSYDFNIASHDGTNGLSLAGTVVTTSAAELNLIDGGTARGTTSVASGDGILINDGGTMRQTNVDTVSTYFASHSVGGGNIVTTGALDSGSITSGFGTINTGSSTITTSGVVSAGGFTIGSAAITEAELEILDGATVTTAEFNLIDGDTARGTTAVASGDGILINDGGTMRQTNVDTVSTYFASHNVGGGNIVTTGALNSGSITSGFGTINNGSSTITTTGAVATGTIAATGAVTATDTTAPLILKYDAGEYVTHAVSAAGVYSIATTDASSDSGAITLDTVDSITLDSDTAGEGIVYADGGTNLLRIFNSSSDVIVKPLVDAKDIVFQQYDGNEVCRITDNRRLYFYDEGGEYISSSGSALTIASGGVAWELPAADGDADQVLKTDGSGNLDWVANSGSGGVDAANGSNDRVATFSDSDSLNGEANLTFDGTNLVQYSDGNNPYFRIGDDASNYAQLGFDSANNTLNITGASGGGGKNSFMVNDTSNSFMSYGITINQSTFDNEILAFKSSDVAHGMDTVAETDTFATFGKRHGDYGGLLIHALMDPGETSPLMFNSTGSNPDDTRSTAGKGMAHFDLYKTNGTGRTSLGGTENLVTFADANTTRFIFAADGTGHADVAWTTYSDARLKKNIEPVPYGLDEVLQLEPKVFDKHSGSFGEAGEVVLEDNGKRQIGFLAQDVKELMPELVDEVDDSKSFYSLSDGKLAAVLVRAIQELNAKLEAN